RPAGTHADEAILRPTSSVEISSSEVGARLRASMKHHAVTPNNAARFSSSRWYLRILLPALLLIAASSCQTNKPPSKSTREYNEVVRAFYMGWAALEVGDDIQADARLAQVATLAATEPAGWANWGLLALRQRNYDQAADRLERARWLSSDNDQIQYLIG